jgi:hypothetical protein
MQMGQNTGGHVHPRDRVSRVARLLWRASDLLTGALVRDRRHAHARVSRSARRTMSPMDGLVEVPELWIEK